MNYKDKPKFRTRHMPMQVHDDDVQKSKKRSRHKRTLKQEVEEAQEEEVEMNQEMVDDELMGINPEQFNLTLDYNDVKSYF